MGLFSFIKSIGEKLTGADVTPESLSKYVNTLGLPVKNFMAKVSGDDVEISGITPDIATKEKLILAVGNLHGVEKVTEHIQVGVPAPAVAPTTMAEAASAAAAVPEVAPTSKFHTVQAGDTLSKIAREEYGNANLYNAIFEANKPMLSHPDKIFPGQVLRIPPQAA